MDRRRLFILSITSLIASSIGLGRKSVAVQRGDDASLCMQKPRSVPG